LYQGAEEKIMEELRQSPDPEFQHSVDNGNQNHDIPTPATSTQHEPRTNITTQQILKQLQTSG
jgi:hypothetical protein